MVDDVKIIPTCLFLDCPLGTDTRIEHTIPRKIGGRIYSREVSSNEFNNRCSVIDNELRRAYEPLLNRLNPLLPAEAKQSPVLVYVDGEPSGLIVESGGMISRRSNAVLKRDEFDKPTKIIGPEMEPLKAMARQIDKGGNWTVTSAPPTSALSAKHTIPTLAAEIEIAALKAVLLSFDHLLRDSKLRFTRWPCVDAVRSVVRESVVSSTKFDLRNLIHHSLGLQYEKAGLYKQLRERLKAAESPFEHVMFAAPNIPQRTLDIVWLVFGFDPMGFRVSWDYTGPAFCFGITNPILKGCGEAKLWSLEPLDESLCRPTERRACHIEPFDEQDARQIGLEIGKRRIEAVSRAFVLVETLSDDHVFDCLKEADDLSGNAVPLSKMFMIRLRDNYGRRRDDPRITAVVDRITSAEIQTFSGESQNQTLGQANTAGSWSSWLSFYRRCLVQVIDDCGLPEVGFLDE